MTPVTVACAGHRLNRSPGPNRRRRGPIPFIGGLPGDNPGVGLAAGERGSHCGAGAPRWNISTKDGRFFFLGCNSPPAPSQTAGDGFVRMRWGGSTPLLAFEPAAGFALVDITGLRIDRLEIVFDEGYDTGPDNFGLAVLDNIDVNGDMVGRGGTDAD